MNNNIAITLAPKWTGESVSSMRVEIRVSGVEAGAGEAALTYNKSTVMIPFAQYDSLALSDEAGEIEFEVAECPCEASFTEICGLMLKRATVGAFTCSYRVYPRVLPEGYRSSPYFDFRAEPGGINGAGLAFLMLPQKCECRAQIRWDMGEMPTDARGVWSLGAGDAARDTDSQTLRFSYYMAGVMRAMEEREFGIYWFGETPFDINLAAGRVRALFRYMREFFRDPDENYRVFLRRDPFELSNGGTALKRSFMSGYSAWSAPGMEDWFCTLAHELVHNYPHMDDEPAGRGTWFTEGIAEYYSAVLPYRAGIVDARETARHITQKAARYYESPLRDMTNEALARIYWSDRRAQPVPYGRGMVYLANVEAQIRRANRGSIDEIARACSQDDMLTPEKWLEFITERLGEGAAREFCDMCAGKLIVPDAESFAGDFEVVEKNVDIDGKMAVAYEWRAK